MALKPTIFKIKVSLTDLNRNIYESLNLTLAQHPSETTERMLVRLLAYCLNYHEQLEFCKGLSDTEEPDLWLKSLVGDTELWIEVGEPAVERIRKATRQAGQTAVYCFNSKADTWWQIEQPKLEGINAHISQLPWPELRLLAEMVERTMDVSVTISGDSVFVATAKGEVELTVKTLQDSA
ncbi:MAG: YaeQ family protein [Pseudohongiellaceae bacterium]